MRSSSSSTHLGHSLALAGVLALTSVMVIALMTIASGSL